MLLNMLRRLLTPFFLCLDFTHPAWAFSIGQARAVLMLSVGVDIAVQWSAGEPAWWTLLLSGLALLFCWWLPPRLLTAIAHLSLIQAPGSLFLVRIMEAAALPVTTIENTLMGWQLWGVIAFLGLLLRYVRTPRSAWRT